MGKDLDNKFKKGNVEGIIESLAVGLRQDTTLTYGPLPKNQATIDFEYIIENLADPEKAKKVKFSYDRPNYHVKVGRKSYNLSEILKNMDARFLEFNTTVKDQYVNLLNDYKLIPPPMPASGSDAEQADEAYFRAQDTKHQFDDLHYAEMAAINVYTGQASELMNYFLKNKNPMTLSGLDYGRGFEDPSQPNFQYMMRSTLLHIAMTCSGLNKIPNCYVDAVYRGANYENSDRRVRLESIENPGVVTIEAGFSSTSKDGIVINRNDRIMFHDVIGKDIQALSQHPREREVLIPPTQMKWEAHEQEGEVHYYVARPVYTPLGLSQERGSLGVSSTTADELLAKVQNIKALYDAQPGNAKSSSRRNEQITTLMKKAQALLNDPDMKPPEKYQKIKEALESTKRSIQFEKKVLNILTFGKVAKDDSRLERSIDLILNRGVVPLTAKEKAQKLDTMLSIDKDSLKKEYQELQAKEPVASLPTPLVPVKSASRDVMMESTVSRPPLLLSSTSARVSEHDPFAIYVDNIKKAFSAIESNKQTSPELRAEMAYVCLLKVQENVKKTAANAPATGIYQLCERYKTTLLASYPSIAKLDKDSKLQEKRMHKLDEQLNELDKKSSHGKKHR